MRRRRVVTIRPQIDLADVRKQVAVNAAHAANRLAVKQVAVNRLAVNLPALKRHAAILHAAKDHAVILHAVIRLGAKAVDPTEALGHHAVVPKNRPHAPLPARKRPARKLAAPKAFVAMTTLSSSMTTMPTVSAAACSPKQSLLATKATNRAQDRGDVVGVEAVALPRVKIVQRSKVRPN